MSNKVISTVLVCF